MRADARVKWRFQRSAVSVYLRDGSKIRDSAVSCCRASSRDAMPSAFRLPRPRCGLAMTQKMVGFAIKPTIFISEMFEIRLAGAPCFATGCHAFGLKIATAAMRPRNDTGSERVYLGKPGFWVLYRVFSSRLSVFVPPFLQKTAVRTETRSHGGFGMRRALRECSLRRLRRMQPVCKNYSRLEKCLMVRTI